MSGGVVSFAVCHMPVVQVESMPEASEEQLARHDDICAICHSAMRGARITPCGHIFHCVCLRKWLYVKESCPMCHSDITRRQGPTENASSDDLAKHGSADPRSTDRSESNVGPNDVNSDAYESSSGSSTADCSEGAGDCDMEYDELETVEADKMFLR